MAVRPNRQGQGIGRMCLEEAARLARAGVVIAFETGDSHNARNLTAYEFPLDQRIVHDMIDPVRGDQQVDKVYPVLLDLILPKASS